MIMQRCVCLEREQNSEMMWDSLHYICYFQFSFPNINMYIWLTFYIQITGDKINTASPSKHFDPGLPFFF